MSGQQGMPISDDRGGQESVLAGLASANSRFRHG